MMRLLTNTAVAAALLGAGAARAAAQAAAAPADTLRVAEALRIAREANPMLRAARASARAAVERIGPAGALPSMATA